MVPAKIFPPNMSGIKALNQWGVICIMYFIHGEKKIYPIMSLYKALRKVEHFSNKIFSVIIIRSQYWFDVLVFGNKLSAA